MNDTANSPTNESQSDETIELAQNLQTDETEFIEEARQTADVVGQTDSVDWQIGDVILDLYEVKGVLGKGGFGKVYRVRHKNWNIDLAVKTPLLADHAALQQAAVKENFVKEAETWVKLGLHPHTVSCFYVRDIEGVPRVFAECVEGGSLEDWIEHSGKLYEGGKEKALERILDIAIQFAWGLAYAHEQGLVHRDVKPANVMMTPDGTAKVTDFGLARARAYSEATAAENADPKQGVLVAGSGEMTPAYCSPEQERGEQLSPATDIWSWGLSVLAMFAGGRSWVSGSAASEALEEYVSEGPENEELPAVPAALAEFLGKCFQENPVQRPKTMLEAADKLIEIYQESVGQVYPRERFAAAEAIADSLNNRAVSMMDLGQKEEALRLWDEALRVQQQHPESTYNRGLILWRSALLNDDALVREMEEVKRQYPNNRTVDYLLGQIHLERDDMDAAIAAFSRIEDSAEANLKEVKDALRFAEERKPFSTRQLRTFEGHTDRINSVSFSGDGKFALSGSWDSTLKLWDTSTGECLRSFEGHISSVQSVSFSADGKFALSGGWDKTLKLWDVSTGECLRTFTGHTSMVYSVSLSTDGKLALSGSEDKTLKLWDVSTGKCLRTFTGHTVGVYSVSFSTDGKSALSGSLNQTKLWKVSTGECLRSFESHTDTVMSVSFSADSKFALSGCADRTKLWDISTGECLRTFEGYKGRVNSVSFSADGKFALSGSNDKTVKLWDVSTGKCLRSFEGHTSGVNSISLSADSKFALSGSADKTLRLWVFGEFAYSAQLTLCQILESTTAIKNEATVQDSLAKAEEAFAKLNIIETINCIRQARAVTSYERNPEAIKLWTNLYLHLPRKKLKAGWNHKTLEDHTVVVYSVSFSADGKFALSGSWNKTKLWDVATGKCLRSFEDRISSYVEPVSFSADGRFALSGSIDKTKLWDVSTSECLRSFEGHTDRVNSVSFSADGKFALSGSSNKILKLWDMATGKCLRSFEGDAHYSVNSVSFSADNRFALSGGWDKTLRLWDVVTGECLRTFEGHTHSVNSASLSADDKFMLSGSEDKTLRLWDVATGKCLRSFEGHTDTVKSVSLSADSRFALSGSSDNTLKLWDLATGECLRSFEGHTDSIISVSLSADGKYALSGSKDKTLKLWLLDWELEEREPVDWEEGARVYLQQFLILQTPYAGTIPVDREPTEEEITLALTRRGKPVWNEEDFERLIFKLGCAGFGYIKPEGVRRELEKMVAEIEQQSEMDEYSSLPTSEVLETELPTNEAELPTSAEDSSYLQSVKEKIQRFLSRNL